MEECQFNCYLSRHRHNSDKTYVLIDRALKHFHFCKNFIVNYDRSGLSDKMDGKSFQSVIELIIIGVMYKMIKMRLRLVLFFLQRVLY